MNSRAPRDGEPLVHSGSQETAPGDATLPAASSGPLSSPSSMTRGAESS
jgi:hypothetical protein